MAFTRVLFYPTIDIRDEGWLKTAFLDWDTIYTIVPESIDSPYNKTARIFFHEGLLQPYKIVPASMQVKNMTASA